MVEPDEFTGGYDKAGGSNAAEGADLEDFELPVSVTEQSGNPTVTDYHTIESHSFLKRQRVFFGFLQLSVGSAESFVDPLRRIQKYRHQSFSKKLEEIRVVVRSKPQEYSPVSG